MGPDLQEQEIETPVSDADCKRIVNSSRARGQEAIGWGDRDSNPMPLVRPKTTTSTSIKVLEDAFTAKYDWLLKWALSFAQGDRAVAEDLVQDTFVRFIVAQGTIEDPGNAEPLLYTISSMSI